MSLNFFLFFIEISVFYPSPVTSTGAVTSTGSVTELSDRADYFLSMTFLAASTMWAASIP